MNGIHALEDGRVHDHKTLICRPKNLNMQGELNFREFVENFTVRLQCSVSDELDRSME